MKPSEGGNLYLDVFTRRFILKPKPEKTLKVNPMIKIPKLLALASSPSL